MSALLALIMSVLWVGNEVTQKARPQAVQKPQLRRVNSVGQFRGHKVATETNRVADDGIIRDKGATFVFVAPSNSSAPVVPENPHLNK